MIYLDNAATSHPKPPSVVEAVCRCLTEIGGNPGRSGHRLSANAARVIFDSREALARIFHVKDSRNIVFTAGATHSLNTVLFGLLQKNDHVVIGSMEHNAVMRPLKRLRAQREIRITVVGADRCGRVSPAALSAALCTDTRLVIVNHGSNVNGAISPIAEIKDVVGEIPLLVDAAQTAGAYPIDVERDGIDFMAFSGHKSLLGPQGIGGLYLRPGLHLAPLVYGGTGSRSEEDVQPVFLPDRFEAGTPNTPGIAGLGAGADYLLARDVASIHREQTALVAVLVDGLRQIPGLQFVGEMDDGPRLPTVSFRLRDVSVSETVKRLDKQYDIMTRAGLHCAPEAHRTFGTFPAGAVRLSLGIANTKEELHRTVEALAEIASR